jgi:hypothetical protein
MKKVKTFLLSVVLCCFAVVAAAQWSTKANGDVYTFKEVSIGATSNVAALLGVTGGDLRITDGNLAITHGGISAWVKKSSNSNTPDGVSGGVWHPGNFNFSWGGLPIRLGIGLVTGTQWDQAGFLSTTIGYNTTASGDYSFSIGYESKATNTSSVAIGNSSASGKYSSSLGQSSVSGEYGFAAGKSGVSSEYGFAAGNSTVNAGAYATAVGASLADGDYSLSAGRSYTNGHYSSAFGWSEADGDYSVAGGNFAIAAGDNSIAFGSYINAWANNSMVLGNGTKGNAFKNTIDNSLMVAFNCTDIPSVFVGPADPKKEAKFGWVGIGTTAPQSELAVNGTITSKAMVTTMTGWPDYVFNKDHKIMSLEETEQFIETHHHLPDVTPAQEIEDHGLNLGEMSKMMMQKIEELTIHLISLKKENDSLRKTVQGLEKRTVK